MSFLIFKVHHDLINNRCAFCNTKVTNIQTTLKMDISTSFTNTPQKQQGYKSELCCELHFLCCL